MASPVSEKPIKIRHVKTEKNRFVISPRHRNLKHRGNFVIISKIKTCRATKSSTSLLVYGLDPHDLQNQPHSLSLSHLTQSSIWPSMAASETSNGTALRYAFGNVLSFFILLLIGVLAFSIRLFSVSSSQPHRSDLFELFNSTIFSVWLLRK